MRELRRTFKLTCPVLPDCGMDFTTKPVRQHRVRLSAWLCQKLTKLGRQIFERVFPKQCAIYPPGHSPGPFPLADPTQKVKELSDIIVLAPKIRKM